MVAGQLLPAGPPAMEVPRDRAAVPSGYGGLATSGCGEQATSGSTSAASPVTPSEIAKPSEGVAPPWQCNPAAPSVVG
jgi:hypothetical protein